MWQAMWHGIVTSKLFEGATAGLLILIVIAIKKLSKTPQGFFCHDSVFLGTESNPVKLPDCYGGENSRARSDAL
jgi:hypothetical protein